MTYTNQNNTWFATPKDDNRDRIAVEIGDSKQPDFKPQIKVTRWDNERNLSLRLQHNENNPLINSRPDKVSWDGSIYKVRTYDVAPNPTIASLREGGHEFQTIITQPVPQNRVRFSVVSKGIYGVVQPELTAAEIAAGAFRPDEAIGSIVFFNTIYSPNLVGGKVYGPNVFGRLLRPWIIAANGKAGWGTFDYKEQAGLLDVIIPDDIANDPTSYPILHSAGTTMGYTTIGASQWSRFNIAAGGFCISKASPLTGGTISSVTAYVENANDPGTTNIKTAIWKTSDKTLVGASSAFAFSGSSAGSPQWQTNTWTQDFSGINHYVGFIAQDGNTVGCYYDTGSAGDGGTGTNSYSTPTTLGTISFNTNKFSIYATYTAVVSLPSAGIIKLQAVNRAATY